MGRPTKLTEEFLLAAEGVLATDDALIFTDAELLAEINERLPDERRVGKSTFERWKADDSEGECAAQFRGLIEKALRREKRNLFDRLRAKDDTQWTRWAWIIERKFDEWNIRRKLATDVTVREDPAAALAAAVLGDAPGDEG